MEGITTENVDSDLTTTKAASKKQRKPGKKAAQTKKRSLPPHSKVLDTRKKIKDTLPSQETDVHAPEGSARGRRVSKPTAKTIDNKEYVDRLTFWFVI